MILAIETSDILCSIAFWEKGRSLLEYNLELAQQHATLVGSLTGQGLTFLSAPERLKKYSADDIELVAVSIGPGSFTGLRIGLSFAQGFCSAKNLPVAGISNHQILAAQRLKMDGAVFTIIEARRNEVYFASHKIISDAYTQIDEHKIVNKNELAEIVPTGAQLIFSKDLHLSGEVRSALSANNIIVIDNARFTSNFLAGLAQSKIEIEGPDKLADLEPLYIRPFAGAM